jgi:hypothetical protein
MRAPGMRRPCQNALNSAARLRAHSGIPSSPSPSPPPAHESHERTCLQHAAAALALCTPASCLLCSGLTLELFCHEFKGVA